MNLSGSYIKVAGCVDNTLGKVFNKINEKIEVRKVPEALKQELYSKANLDASKKYTKRKVLTVINDITQQKVENTFSGAIKLASADPSPDAIDLASDIGEFLNKSNLIENKSLRKAAEVKRKYYHDYDPDILGPDVRNIIDRYLKNPINVLKLYTT